MSYDIKEIIECDRTAVFMETKRDLAGGPAAGDFEDLVASAQVSWAGAAGSRSGGSSARVNSA